MSEREIYENMIVAMTPGGIEAQEKRGQQDFVASAHLPIPTDDQRETLTSMGVQFGESVDDLFCAAQLPEGWTKRATDHDMWSEVVDESGVVRFRCFYKAAFYDRRARIYMP